MAGQFRRLCMDHTAVALSPPGINRGLVEGKRITAEVPYRTRAVSNHAGVLERAACVAARSLHGIRFIPVKD